MLLILNVGSSSLKFALFAASRKLECKFSGSFEHLGTGHPELHTHSVNGGSVTEAIQAKDARACLPHLRRLLEAQKATGHLEGIGHRIVHGGPNLHEHQFITAEVLQELRRCTPLAPNHLPGEIAFIEETLRHFPAVPQAACFDTAFHHELPREASLLPIPRRYEAKGLRRYGFHGLSYGYLVRELARVAGEDLARRRVVLAHLGSGASMAAVENGRSLDTTMGLTPLGGLVMSTRSGDIDPGLLAYLAAEEKLTPDQVREFFSSHCGLLGLSETTGDVRDLLAREAGDARAADALAVFCHQARKHLAAMAASLGGLDAVVFSGGVGENSAVLRDRICAPLGFLGIQLGGASNVTHGPLISKKSSPVKVYVIKTDEEREMAQITLNLLGAAPQLSPSAIHPDNLVSP
jgi:acetate kinase